MKLVLAALTLSSLLACKGNQPAPAAPAATDDDSTEGEPGVANPDPVQAPEVARLIARKLAFEAYPQWSMKPANAGTCPTLDGLFEYMSQSDNDPWGRPYEIVCSPDGDLVEVLSFGPDGEQGTGDDIRSHE